jgi:branched-chain amino acid transport system permease protein
LWHQLTVPVELGGSQVPLVDLLTILACLASLSLLAAFLKFTRTGMEIRAASENLRMATLLGIRTNRIIAVSFAIVGFLAAVTALILVVKTGRLDYRLGVPLTISGFMATAIGGMGSLSGPVLGGFLLGAVTVFLQFVLPEELRDMRQSLVFGVVLVLLVCLPGGLVRPKGGEERV